MSKVNKQAWRKRISEEYGEPWRDVVNGFLDMGYSLNRVADIIGVQRQTLVLNGFESRPKLKTHRDKEKELGISRATYWRWRNSGKLEGDSVAYGFK